MNSKKTPPEDFGASRGSPISGYPADRHFTRQTQRRAYMTPQRLEEWKKKFGETHEPLPTSKKPDSECGDSVDRGGCVVSILRDEETGEEEVTITYRPDVDV